MTENPAMEFSYSLPTDTIGTAEKAMRIVADEAARAALAHRFDLIAIDQFVADVTVVRIADSAMIKVSGSFRADIVQACVVSHEPVATQMEEAFSVRLEPSGDGVREAVFDIDDEDPPEPFSGDSIELGELLAQNLAILIDPYPRAVGAVPEVGIEIEDPVAARRSNRPFESLAVLKKNPK